MLDALRLHVERRQLAHFSGADHGDVQPLDVAEDLLGEGDRGEADRHGARGQAGLGADALADGERRVKEAVEDRPDHLHLGRDGVGFLHLAEDLRLADDERVEARRDAEEVTRGVEVGDVVDVGRDLRRVDAVELADERHQIAPRGGEIVARRVHLGAVAGRQHHGLPRRPARRQRAERLVHAARVEVDPLAQLDRRGPMADSDEKQMHG